MEDLIGLYAPRLSLARSVEVPQAFKDFYNVSFSSIRAEAIPEPVRLFLEDVLAAVPGMIEVPGLLVRDTFSQVSALCGYRPDFQEESEAKFPHAQSLATPVEEVQSEPEVLVDQTEVDIAPPTEVVHEEPKPETELVAEAPTVEIAEEALTKTADTTEEYDADVSQSQVTQSQAVADTPAQPQSLSRRAKKARQTALKAALSPIVSEEGEQSQSAVSSRQSTPASIGTADNAHVGETVDQAAVSMQVDQEDVFGPAARTIVSGKKVKTRKSKRGSKRPLGESESESAIPCPKIESQLAGLPVAKRSRLSEEPTPAEADSSHSLPAPTALVPATSEVTTESAESAEPAECITVYESPPRHSDTRRSKRRSRLEGVSSEIMDFSGTPPPVSTGNEKSKTSLLNSARGWLARVPSLFSPTMTITSPTQPTKPVVAEMVDDMDDTASVRTTTSASEHGEGEPVVLIEVPKRKRGRPRKSESLPSVLQAKPRKVEEEDELLLSPETAVKRRREEEGDIAAAVERGECWKHSCGGC